MFVCECAHKLHFRDRDGALFNLILKLARASKWFFVRLERYFKFANGFRVRLSSSYSNLLMD